MDQDYNEPYFNRLFKFQSFLSTIDYVCSHIFEFQSEELIKMSKTSIQRTNIKTIFWLYKR